MAKFADVIGFGQSVESAPGVHQDVITERQYFGDVIRNTRQLREGDKINNDITVNNSISIVADAYAIGNILAIRYIKWMGSLWSVTDVEVQRPRLLLRLGGVYNGQTASPSESP